MSSPIQSVEILGSDLAAHCLWHFLKAAGIHRLRLQPAAAAQTPRGQIIGANVARLLRTIDESKLNELANTPDREQVRLAQSGFLLSEMPLGKFYEDRYLAPLINIEQADLLEIVQADSESNSETGESTNFDVTVDTRPAETESSGYRLWQSKSPIADDASLRVNITWIGDDFLAWQFATKSNLHFVWFAKSLPEPDHLHPALHGFLDCDEPIAVGIGPVKETMYAGNTAFVSAAVSKPWPTQLPFLNFGVEDTWVLARMLENYEDDLSSALSEYEKYRLPRHRKVLSYSELYLNRYLHKSGMARVSRNLGIALRTRFLPEMAMQQVDWFYQYDCIRGFR